VNDELEEMPCEKMLVWFWERENGGVLLEFERERGVEFERERGNGGGRSNCE
jgi:hypothetical protein